MKFSDYLKDHRLILLVCLTGGLFFSALLLSFGTALSELALLWICFVLITFAVIICCYLQQRRRIRYLLSLSDSLDQKYLIAEIAKKPSSASERVYFRLMKTALKSMTDEVAGSNRMKNEYREFVEQWVHEIKIPVSGIQLICENNKTDTTRKIITQAELIGQAVERVLFYARLGNVEKDYLIKEISLKACVREVLARNKYFLIENGVCVYTDAVTGKVCSDSKWIEFILNQIISNSIKYRGSQPPVIELSTEDAGDHTILSVTDNGMGIKESEINRVFDKGFVGSNGRCGSSATGMGLYLCKKLCARLGIDMELESEWERFTKVCLYFPRCG